MKLNLKAKLLLAAVAVAPIATMPAATATAQQVVRPSQEIVLSIGKGELVQVPGNMTDVFVANEEVADVQIKSQRQLYVFGRSGGETTIYASNERGDVIFSANIRVGSNIGSVDQMMALAMPDAKISVSTMGTNTVLLTGTVGAPEDAAEAERLVQAFLGEEANVITRLRTATPLQVNLKVTFAEVSRSLVRAMTAPTVSASASARVARLAAQPVAPLVRSASATASPTRPSSCPMAPKSPALPWTRSAAPRFRASARCSASTCWARLTCPSAWASSTPSSNRT